jgi:hypothetical protein
VLGLAEDFPFDGILALAGANDAVNLVNRDFMARWKRTKDAYVPTTFGSLTDFVIEQLEYWAEQEQRVVGYLGSGSMPTLLKTKALGRDLVCGSTVQPFLFHLNMKVENRRQDQLEPGRDDVLRVTYLPLTIYDDEAFLKLRDVSDVRRTLKVDAYPMFVRDILNRGAIYMSHLQIENHQTFVFACAGELPMAKMDGSDLIVGKDPKEDHAHNGISCGVEPCLARGLETSLAYPLEQKVSCFFLNFAFFCYLDKF